MFQTGKKNVQRKSGMTTEQFFFFFLSCILSSFCWTSQKGKIFYFLSVAVRLPISFFFLGVQSKGRAHCPYSRSLAVRDQHG